MTEESTSNIGHVSFKAPQFLNNNVTAWFTIVEAQFTLSRIVSEETKFLNVIALLPTEVVGNLPRVILAERKFSTLKEVVISNYEKTKPELFDKLISSSVMMGRPSQYLNDIQQTALKVGVGEDLIKHKFIQALPPSIGPIIASQKDLTLTQLGKLSDELLPFAQQSTINLVPERQRNLTRGNSSTNKNQNLSVTHFSSGQLPKVCRSHLYFADKAKFCKPWCKWPNKSPRIPMQPNSRSSSPARVPEN